MGFFQSFISDANRNGQYFKQAEPVERAFVSESPSREMPTDAVNLSDAVFTHLYSTDPSTDVEQNGLSEMAETKHAEQTASKHKTESVLQQAAASIVAPSRQPEIHSESRQQVEPPSTVAPAFVSKHMTEPVLQQAAASIAALSRQPEIHSESRQQVEPPSTVAPAFVSKHKTEPVLQKAAASIAALSQQPEIHSESRQQVEPPSTVAPAFVSKHKTESVLQQAAASIVAPSRQPEIHSESRQQVEPPSTVAPAFVSKHMTEPVLQKAAAPIVAPNRQPGIHFEPRPTDGPVAIDEARGSFLAQQKTNNSAEPLRLESLDRVAVGLTEEEVFVRPVRKSPSMSEEITQERASVSSPKTQEAVMQESAVAIQQAKQALGLFSPLAEKSSSVRERSEPQVQIGMIEIIVESAPVTQQKSSPNTQLTHDPGRCYQRRL